MTHLPPPRSIVGTLTLAIASLVAVLALLPPVLADKGLTVGDFSAARAMVHVVAIAALPRPVGSPGHAQARAYLIDTLARLGLEVSEQKTHFASLLAGNLMSSEVDNVIGRLRGTSATREAVLLAAHYDSVPSGPGASDDAFGVATLLETARALAATPRLQHDVLFLFSDAEELGLLGAQAFVAESAARADVKIALNFDARGTHGAVAMFDTSPNNGALVRALAEAAPYPVASSFVSSLAQALPNDTDASAFKRAGIPTYSFAYADGVEHYHRFTDVAEAMDPQSLAHGGSYALSLARHFGNSDLSRFSGAGGGDVIYFDLLGRALASYSKLAARVLAVATLLLGALLVHRARRNGLHLSGVLRAFRDVVVALFGAALVAGALQLALAQIVPLYFLMARAKIFVPAIILGSLAFTVLWLGRQVSPRAREELTYGGALLFGSILLLLAIAIPVLTAPFQWPLAFALVGIAVGHFAERYPSGANLARYASLAPASFMMSQLVYATLVAAGATMPFVPAVFAALFLVLVFPVVDGVTQAGARRVALMLALGSVLLLGVGAATCHYDANEPGAGSLLYGIDVDTGTALWFTRDQKVDSRVATRVSAGSKRVAMPAFTRSDVAYLATSAAPITRLPARIEQAKSETAEHGRLLEFAVRASADARCWELWQESAPNAPIILDQAIEGAAVTKFVRFSPELDAKLMRAMTLDPTRVGWHMMHCGAGERPVDLALHLAGEGELTLRLVELVDGLPVGDSPIPSADSVQTTGRAQGSDVILVSRLLRL